ncbi:tannase/feruloyl esterase family alpha/beta hydrolase, partial [Acidobacteriota bacterium]
GTDTGHEGHPLDASWALNNMERIVNFGHQAVHRTAVTAKALIEAYYQQDITRSYFFGCSRGGGQALMEAQRYPDDFDGIVCGAPAYDWTMGLGAGTIQIMQAMYPDPDNLQEAVLGPKELQLIESAILEHCDELDGIKDGILNDPRQCDFDIESLLCKGEKTDSCLTEEQIRAAKAIYEGPKDKQGDMFYGFPFGGETDPAGWPRWLTGGLKYLQDLDDFQSGVEVGDYPAPIVPNVHYGFGHGVMRYFIYHDPDWSYAGYDFETFREDAKLVGETLNATNPDLSEFRARGGKFLMYTGWSDAAITALGTIGYYENVLAHDATSAKDVRLFMMPGVLHCAGGPGPWYINWVEEIDRWVETNVAPDQINAYFIDEENQPAGSRPLCAYPQVAVYDGNGDPRDASSFSCGNIK